VGRLVIADYDEAPGWPAEATPVHHDPERIGPRVLTRERRLECSEANVKWLSSKENRDKARAAKREYHRRQAALRIIRTAALAMAAAASTSPGAAP
jgi:hypothetical protein